jgi:hypothetical protein
MKLAKFALSVSLYAAMAQGQTNRRCEQQCTAAYDICTSAALTQLNQCLSASAEAEASCSQCEADSPGAICPYCASAVGCTNNPPTCPTAACCMATKSNEDAICEANYEAADSICGNNYNECITLCIERLPCIRTICPLSTEPT